MRRQAYRLAAKLGRANVDAMLRGMSWEHFKEWMAYQELEPFEEERGDLRDAHIVSTVINLLTSGSKRSLNDVLLRYGRVDTSGEVPALTAQQRSMRHQAVMWQWVAAFGLKPQSDDQTTAPRRAMTRDQLQAHGLI